MLTTVTGLRSSLIDQTEAHNLKVARGCVINWAILLPEGSAPCGHLFQPPGSALALFTTKQLDGEKQIKLHVSE